MLHFISKGTIIDLGNSFDSPQIYLLADEYSSVEDFLEQGQYVRGDSSCINLHRNGIVARYHDSLSWEPSAVTSWFVANGSMANHWALATRSWEPNRTQLCIEWWPGEWCQEGKDPDDQSGMTYYPPHYPDRPITRRETLTIAKVVRENDWNWWFERHWSRDNFDSESGALISHLEDHSDLQVPKRAGHPLGEGILPSLEWCDSIIMDDVRKCTSQFGAIHDTLFRKCIDSLPKVNANNIDNIRSIVDGMTALLSKRPKFPSTLKGLAAKSWLSWRYQYTTTKLDVEEMAKKIPSMSSCEYLGRARYSGPNTSFSAKLLCRDAYQEALINRLYAFADSWGLAPTWENLWDMLPFTFMIDWFTDWADFAHEVHNQKRLEQQYTVLLSTFGYSVKGRIRSKYCLGTYKYYNRTASNLLTLDEDVSWVDTSSTSNKTWCFRLIDSITMLIS